MRKKADTVRMLELREQGLSNAQIALEMDVSTNTVLNHIGPLGKGIVAKYGSIASHVKGESFLPNATKKEDSFEGFRPCSKRVEEEEKKRIKIDNPCVHETVETHSYKGRDMVYTITKSYDDEASTQSVDIYHDGSMPANDHGTPGAYRVIFARKTASLME